MYGRRAKSAGAADPGSVEQAPSQLDQELPGEPRIIARQDHCVSRKNIDPDALKVLGRLNRFGYQAFLVGGGVRDLLLNKQPKDYDIGTNATIKQVCALFRNSRVIGRRFKLVHLYFRGGKIIEVATFRDLLEVADESESLLLRSDNTFGTAETDAMRRDLTINGLFYESRTFSIIDYVGGIEDLENKVIRIIGEPHLRFQEDPVRMIRAIRHAARTGFQIEHRTWTAICELSEMIQQCATARVYEELLRELRGGYSLNSMRLMFETGLLAHLIPSLYEGLRQNPQERWDRFERILRGIDSLVMSSSEEVPAYFLFAALVIGNFDKGQLSARYSAISDELEQLVWQEVPQQLPLQISSAGVAMPLRILRSELSMSIRAAIDEMFHPLGLPRRERDNLERVLYGRVMLFRRFEEGSSSLDLTKKSYFADSLRLVELTATSEKSMQCLSFWRDKLNEKREPKKRRRRRPRRRRRAADADTSLPTD